MYCDSPLTTIHAIPKRSVQWNAKTVLVLPDGKAWGRVNVPETMQGHILTPRTKSRWARIGMHVGTHQTFSCEGPGVMAVGIFNWSAEYSLVVRKGDAIALTYSEWVADEPPIRIIPLTANSVFIRVKKESLPTETLIPFLDPQGVDLPTYMEAVPYHALPLNYPDWIVLPACEEPEIPEGCIGFITSTLPGTLHNSAQYAHAGPPRKIALEFKIFEPLTIKVGMRVANLSIYRAPYAVVSHPSSLDAQKDSIIPAAWQ